MISKNQKPAKNRYRKASFLLFGVLLAIGAFILLPQLDTYSHDFVPLSTINIGLLVVSFVCVFMTYAAAAFCLTQLALKPLSFSGSLMVQVASGFATKLLPAGIGGFSINTRYLTKQKHSLLQATSIMTLNTLLGVLGHIFILGVSFLLASQTTNKVVSFQAPPALVIAMAGGGIVVFCLSLAVPFVRKKARLVLRELRRIIRSYQSRQHRIVKAFLAALAVTLLFTTALYLCAKAVNAPLTYFQSLLVFTAGLVGASVTPTPGGVGGAEAALTAAMVTLGVNTGTALSVALLFRGVSYWLPIVPGIIFFRIVQQKQLI